MKRSALITAVMVATLVAQDAEGFCVMGADGNIHTDEPHPFVDPPQDFSIRPGTCAAKFVGQDLIDVTHDFHGNERPKGRSTLGAIQMPAPDPAPSIPKGLAIEE